MGRERSRGDGARAAHARGVSVAHRCGFRRTERPTKRWAMPRARARGHRSAHRGCRCCYSASGPRRGTTVRCSAFRSRQRAQRSMRCSRWSRCRRRSRRNARDRRRARRTRRSRDLHFGEPEARAGGAPEAWRDAPQGSPRERVGASSFSSFGAIEPSMKPRQASSVDARVVEHVDARKALRHGHRKVSRGASP